MLGGNARYRASTILANDGGMVNAAKIAVHYRWRPAKSTVTLAFAILGPALAYLLFGIPPIIGSLLATVLVFGLLAVRTSTATLIRGAAGIALVPWSLHNVVGVPPSFASIPIATPLIMGCIAILLARRGLRPLSKSTRLPPPARAVIASTTLLILSSLSSWSLRAAMPWMVGIGLFVTIADGYSRNVITAGQVLKSIVVAQSVVATWDLLQLRTGYSLLPSMNVQSSFLLESGVEFLRFNGSLGDYELYGEINAFCLSAALGLAVLAHTRSRRTGWLLLTIPLAGAALETGSRGGVVVVVVALALMCLVGRKVRGLLALIVIAIPTLVLGSNLAVFARFSRLNFNEPLPRILNRQLVWDRFLATTRGDLWTPLGHGLAYPYESIGEYPHNLGLVLLYMGGVIGASAFLGAIIWLALRVCRVGFEGHSTMAKIVGPLLIAVLLDQIKIEFVRLDSYIVTFFVMLSVGAGVLTETRRVRKSPSCERPRRRWPNR